MKSKYLVLFIFINLINGLIAQENTLELKLIDIDAQSHTVFATAEDTVNSILSVKVVNQSGQGIPNIPVFFNLISAPGKSKNSQILTPLVYTDSTGIVTCNFVVGTKSGEYIISSRIKGQNNSNDIIHFKINVKKKDWIFFLIMGLLGGLGLFLFGMNLLSEGLKKTAGNKLRSILSSVTNNRIIAVGVGTFVTMIIQSSSATTVMLVSFVQAGLMSFAQTLGIILGADIGTTVTIQLIAFKVTDYALLLIAIGFGFLFLSKSKKIKNIGQAILGFGILFFGMNIMSDSMYPLRTYQPFIDLLLELENPLLGILVGTLLTALIQSSSAFLGIVIVLSMQGLITLEAAIPLILGANVGTSITAMLASLNTGRDAKRVALAHTLFKLIGAFIFVWWIPSFTEIVRSISPDMVQDNGANTVIPRQIANAHTLFNVGITLIFLPLLKYFEILINKLLPDKLIVKEQPYKTKFLEDSLISAPALALNLAKAEVIEMANKVISISQSIIEPFFEERRDVFAIVKETENEIDYLHHQTNKYLTKIIQQEISEEVTEEAFQILQCAAEFEQIADLVSDKMRGMAKKRIKFQLEFSDEGKEEIIKFHTRTLKQLNRSLEVFSNLNLERGKKLEVKYQKYKASELDLKRSHFERLKNDISESKSTSSMHLELIDLFLRINRHAASIGRIMLGHLDDEIDEDEKRDLSQTMIEE